jgi:hypothetical protein
MPVHACPWTNPRWGGRHDDALARILRLQPSPRQLVERFSRCLHLHIALHADKRLLLALLDKCRLQPPLLYCSTVIAASCLVEALTPESRLARKQRHTSSRIWLNLAQLNTQSYLHFGSLLQCSPMCLRRCGLSGLSSSCNQQHGPDSPNYFARSQRA